MVFGSFISKWWLSMIFIIFFFSTYIYYNQVFYTRRFFLYCVKLLSLFHSKLSRLNKSIFHMLALVYHI